MSTSPLRLRTIREAYQQVRWDPRLDLQAFVLGYESRGPGTKEVSLEKFVADGDVPWHRVRYLRVGEVRVWDREARVDLLADVEALPSAARKTAAPEVTAGAPDAKVPAFAPLPVWRFDPFEHAWRAYTPSELDALDELEGHAPATSFVTAVTWNVLFDQFEAELLSTEARTPAAMAQLGLLRAHVIALQEVTPAFFDALLREPWVRARYALSDGPEGETVTPSGQVVLTRLPVRSFGRLDFSRHKRAVCAELLVGQARETVTAYALHLTSDHTENAVYLRAKQLRAIYAHAARAGGSGHALILGDLNRDDPEGAEAQESAGFVDAWSALRPAELGLTYDPSRNALAALFSRKGTSSRLDRVLTRGPLLKPVSARLFATEPFVTEPAPLFASDHFGVCVALAVEGADPLAHPKPTYESALAYVLAREEENERVQAIRQAHDARAFRRWPAHINVLYGCLPALHFARAADELATACAAVEPASLRLARFDEFAHRSSVTTYLAPEDEPAGALRRAYAACASALPGCDEQGAKSPAGYTPHMTVAKRAATDPPGAFRADFRSVEAPLRALTLLAREGDTPFVAHYEIPLGGGPPVALEPARELPRGPLGDVLRAAHPRPDAREYAAIAALFARIETAARAVDPAVFVELTGSHRAGLAAAGTDLDLLVLGPRALSAARFFLELEALLATEPDARVRAVIDARVPALRGTVAGLELDVLYASCPEGISPRSAASLNARTVTEFDVDEQRPVLGVLDVDALMALPAARREPEAYRLALYALRSWARARGLSGNAFGLPGGFAWALMGAWGLRDFVQAAGAWVAPEESARAMLAHALERLAGAELRGPLALSGAAEAAEREARREPMVVRGPVRPWLNATRNATEGTRALLTRELTRAAGYARREAWAGLFSRVDCRAEGHTAFVEATARGDDEGAVRDARGWVLGHARGLLLDLERDAGTSVRAYAEPAVDPSGLSVKWRFGLGPGASSSRVQGACSGLRARFDEWRAGRKTSARVTAAFVDARGG